MVPKHLFLATGYIGTLPQTEHLADGTYVTKFLFNSMGHWKIHGKANVAICKFACEAYGPTAALLEKITKKGDALEIEGCLRFDPQAGDTAPRVLVEKIVLLPHTTGTDPMPGYDGARVQIADAEAALERLIESAKKENNNVKDCLKNINAQVSTSE